MIYSRKVSNCGNTLKLDELQRRVEILKRDMLLKSSRCYNGQPAQQSPDEG